MTKLFTFFLAMACFQGAFAIDMPQDTLIYDMPEQMPQFPGGADAMEQFINDNKTYPEEAKAKKIQGKVYVQFVVEKDGSISHIKVRRGAHKILDDEALRIINLMPDWKPGSMRGKKVRTRYIVPITFP